MNIARRAVAFAGGSGMNDATSAGLLIGDDMSVGVAPQLSTGPVGTKAMKDNGLVPSTYIWSHGFVPSPFDPHLALDGVEFENWTDPVLANSGTWPHVNYFMPGDHDGCGCDFYVNWRQA
jgi:hypothetical protein